MATSQRDVRADVLYMRKDAPKTNLDSPEGRPQEHWQNVVFIGPSIAKDGYRYYQHHKVTVVDGRNHLPGGKDAWRFEEHGFCYLPAPAPVRDFQDNKLVEREYQPRILELVKKATGAKQVFWMSHMRRAETVQGLGSGTQGYGTTGHSDYGPAFERQFRILLAQRYGVPEAEAQSCGMCLVNIWRPVERPAYKDPLALLDSSSVRLGTETVSWVLRGIPLGFDNLGGRPVEQRIPAAASDAPALHAVYAPHHRWVYLPDMAVDEAVLFKQYDFRPGATAKATFHTSFKDRFHSAWKECPGRRSVECRLILIFDPDERAPLASANL